MTTMKIFSSILLATITLSTLRAEIPAEQIARLGVDLTPLGGEKAGNASGTIPDWSGGLTEAPEHYIAGQHYVDPFAEDPIEFTITTANMDQYIDQLTAGHQALLKTYPDSFSMNVYPTRRSAAAPQYIYDATRKTAANAKLTDDGNGVENAIIGIPFPVPSNGLEIIWNHMLRWRGNNVTRKIVQVAPTREGHYNEVKFFDRISFHYSNPDISIAQLNNILFYFQQEVEAPAKLSGNILLIHETLNQKKENRKVWLYNPGQRRVRRLPNIAFDNPGTATDGLRTNDQLDMYNGSPELYHWQLSGKKEIYVPYNNYKLQDSALRHEDILKPLHINMDIPRYELHRVWIVEASLKPGLKNIYKKRVFYIDEDSWQILVVDQYDRHDQLWRISEGFAINYYNVPNLWTVLEVHTDLQAGRYVAIGLTNESEPYQFSKQYNNDRYTISSLRRSSRR